MDDSPLPLNDQKVDIGYRTHHEFGADTELTTTIVQSVADFTNQEMMELPPLGNAIHADSLEEIFRPLSNGGTGSIGSLEFQYAGTHVTVHTTGEVTIYEN